MRTTRHSRRREPFSSLIHDPIFDRLASNLIVAAILQHRWLLATTAASVFVLIPYFAAGDPPGVDAPSFLHFGWVFEQWISGYGASFGSDPWWYGGLPYLQAYSPGGYGAAGLLAAATPLSIAGAFKLTMAIGLTGSAAATFWLGRTLGLSGMFSFVAAALFVFSYPVIAGIGIFGWLPTLASMPFAMAAYIAIEKWAVRPSSRQMIYAGALLGLALIAHHMTAIAFGLAIAARMTVVVIDDRVRAGDVARGAALMALLVIATSAWWAIPFLANTISVGFQRELPGNWSFSAVTFVASIFDRGKIGIETFPSYIGYIQGGLGIIGGVYAFASRSRFRGLAIAAALLFWFSMGAGLNPLIRVYPASGFDVSRFAFYVAPMLAVLAAYVVQRAVQQPSLATRRFAPTAAVVIVFVLPITDLLAARETLDPVTQPPEVAASIEWIDDNVAADQKVLAVGYRNWDGHWIPRDTGIRIMDGWYDEGAANWRNVRDYRLMGWLGDVDADRLHEIMRQEETSYLVIVQWDTTDSPALFESAVSARPDLFELQDSLLLTTVYRTR